MELKQLHLKPGEQIMISKTRHTAIAIKCVPGGLELYGPLNDRGEPYLLGGNGFTHKTLEKTSLSTRRLKQDLNVLLVGAFLGLLGGYVLFSG